MKKTFANVGEPVQPRGILGDQKPTVIKKTKSTGGRPPKNAADRASEKITLNLTPAEKTTAQEKAGDVALGVYLRKVLRDAGAI